jgi:predicted protein tyrosine phosphatase
MEVFTSNAEPDWIWRLNWSEITERIVVGSCPRSAADLARIRAEAGAAALLSLQHDDCHAGIGIDYPALRRAGAALGLEMMRQPIRDLHGEDLRARLPAAVGALDALLRTHPRAYVHCTAGIGRAPSVVLGYLVQVEGRPLEDALRLLAGARPGVAPNVAAVRAWRDAGGRSAG